MIKLLNLLPPDNSNKCYLRAKLTVIITVLINVHAKWLIKYQETLERDHEFITRAFKAVGTCQFILYPVDNIYFLTFLSFVH